MIKVGEFFEKYKDGGMVKIAEVIVRDSKKEEYKGYKAMNWERWAVSNGVAEMTIKEWKMGLVLENDKLMCRLLLVVRGRQKK